MKISQKKFESMSRDLKLAYMASANRVTVGHITTVEENTLKRWYIPRIRGMFVGADGDYKHETPELAHIAGQSMLQAWKSEFLAQQPPAAAEGGE